MFEAEFLAKVRSIEDALESAVNSIVKSARSRLTAEGWLGDDGRNRVSTPAPEFKETTHALIYQELESRKMLASQSIACGGCKHFQGHIYNNVPFVCAMHPYGSDSNKCCDHSFHRLDKT